MGDYPRPRCCPEPRCRPIFQRPAPNFLIEGPQDERRREDAPGESLFCWGVMPRPISFVYDGVEHTNDLSACVATPLKGLIRFQENENDWWLMETGYRKARERLGLLYPDRFPGSKPPDEIAIAVKEEAP